jgi:single-stranded-DNA-specific exonuclease
MPTPTHWEIAPLQAERFDGIHLYVSQVLRNRGIATREAALRFLAGEVEHTTEPGAMTGVLAAADRLWHAIRSGEKIAVYGDYDTDGVTACALLVQVLTALGADVRPYIPHREDEGYGLHYEALRALRVSGVRVVVTVDCGIRSLGEAEAARGLDLDLIITDHHEPGAELPAALAVINPKQAGDLYPEKMLAGVGIAFKLAQALVRPLGKEAPVKASDVLDLVGLGTVADLAPLAGENRALVRQALQLLNRPLDRQRRAGLRALYLSAKLQPGRIDAGSIGFVLGPRLNAAGRLESALAAYELMTTADAARAGALAQQLEVQNRERQSLTRETQLRARKLALNGAGEQPLLLFAADPEFRHGVVGLAAARLTDEFYRPAVVARCEDDLTRGSCRSIREFNITEALAECADLLVKYGGHAAAAGFTCETRRLPALAERLQTIARERLGGLDLRKTIRVEAELQLVSVDRDLAVALTDIEPCGYGNPTPVFASRGLRVVGQRTVGGEGQHLKLVVSDGWSEREAIAFGAGAHAGEARPGATLDLAYTIELNRYNGSETVQLNIRDLRPAQVSG